MRALRFLQGAMSNVVEGFFKTSLALVACEIPILESFLTDQYISDLYNYQSGIYRTLSLAFKHSPNEVAGTLFKALGQCD